MGVSINGIAQKWMVFFWSRPCRWPTWSRANYGSQATGAMGMVFIIGIVEIDNS